MLLAGCHDPNTPPDTPAPPSQAHTSPGPHATPPVTTPPAKVVVYVLNPHAKTEETALTPRPVAVQHPDAPIKDAVNALLTARRSPLAADASLRGLTVEGGMATLDFSRSPLKDGGEGAESAGLNALAMTLGQFPELHSYQIKVQGRLVQSFGEFSADGPMDVIRPGETPAAGNGGPAEAGP